MEQIWLPGYEKDTRSGHTGHAPYVPGPSRIVLHTTETRSLPNYPWPPHFTVGVVDEQSLSTYYGKPGTVRRWQHCDLNLTSYALKGNTNSDGDHCVQIEIITYCAKNRGLWPDVLIEVVAHTIADIVGALPELAPALDNYPNLWSRYSTGATRLSMKEWQEGIGGKPFICGHEHVPNNDHWDPAAPVDGKGNIGPLISRVKQIIGGEVGPLPPQTEDDMKEGDSGRSVVELQKRLITRGAKILADGKYGPATAQAVSFFQKAVGLTETGQADALTITKLYKGIKKVIP